MGAAGTGPREKRPVAQIGTWHPDRRPLGAGYAGAMAQLSVRLSTGEQYYIELKPGDGQPETQLQNFLNEEPPFRQKWLETTAGRYVRMSTLVSVELLTLDPDDPRLTS